MRQKATESREGPIQKKPTEAHSTKHHNSNGKIQRQREILKGSKRETGSNTQKSANKASSWFLYINTANQKGIARHITRNEKQSLQLRLPCPARLSIKMEGTTRNFPEKNKAKRILFHQTSIARHAKGTTLRRLIKTVREKGTKVQK